MTLTVGLAFHGEDAPTLSSVFNYSVALTLSVLELRYLGACIMSKSLF